MSDPATSEIESFQGKVIWITGASSGIGEALAHSFAGSGARVVLSARREEELRRVREDCISSGASSEHLLVLPLDVVDHAAMPGAVATVLKAFFSRIDMLINNAGVCPSGLSAWIPIWRSIGAFAGGRCAGADRADQAGATDHGGAGCRAAWWLPPAWRAKSVRPCARVTARPSMR